MKSRRSSKRSAGVLTSGTRSIPTSGRTSGWPPSWRERAQEAERFSPDNLYVSEFVWAPDSKRLAFAGRPSPTLRARGQGNVYIANEAGGESRQVTSLPGGESPVAWTEAHGLLVSGTGQVLGTYNGKLWKVPVSGGEAVSLTDGSRRECRLRRYQSRPTVGRSLDANRPRALWH